MNEPSSETISFAMKCKEEAALCERDASATKALLSGFAKGAGSLKLGAKEELDLATESSAIAKRVYMAFSRLFDAKCRFAYTRGIGFRKKVKYHVLIENPAPILEELGVDFFSSTLPPLAKSEETRKAYLAGAFMASGSVNSPSSSNYHLEIAVGDEGYAGKLCHLLNKSHEHGWNAKVASRRKEYIVYLKHSEQISEFLVFIGASECCLEFEDVRVGRDFANISNRLGNLDMANLAKTTRAAERQIAEIRYFQSRGISFADNPKLEILCRLRLEHPDASLEELADLLSEELATTVSKSNINHLFRALHALYGEQGGPR